MDNTTEQTSEDRIFPKQPLGTMIKFKSMQEILMSQHAWFDGHGNLTTTNMFGEKSHLAPSYFHYLGGLHKFKNKTSFPEWVIEAEYWDIFAPNMALRMIASGKLEKERCVKVANEVLIVP